MTALSPETIGYAFLGGVLPALIWLYFLLKEDARCPEPRPMIWATFVLGMLVVLLAPPLEHLACGRVGSCSPTLDLPILVAWATIEEMLKYLAVALLILWRRSVDESVDYVIYLVTVALGFAALENMLFLLDPINHGLVFKSILTGNIRFVGATVLHLVASATIGFALAFSYKKSRPVRTCYALVGIILAVALHTLFNFLIISGDGEHMFQALFTVWTVAIVFFALFEVLKYSRYRRLPKNVC